MNFKNIFLSTLFLSMAIHNIDASAPAQTPPMEEMPLLELPITLYAQAQVKLEEQKEIELLNELINLGVSK